MLHVPLMAWISRMRTMITVSLLFERFSQVILLLNLLLAVRYTFEQVDLMSRLRHMYPGVFSEPPNGTTAMDVYRSGKIISPYGMEGLHSIGNSFSLLRTFYNLGVRYATLTHNCHNMFADAALQVVDGEIVKARPYWNGISEKGKDLVYEMNRIGMIVDISHVSYETMLDVLGAGKDDWTGSRAPIIFSHSSAFSVCPHPRNVPDDVLQLVKKTGSLVMINFAPGFVSCTAAPGRHDGLPDFYPANSTLEHVVDHILHIGRLVGFEHVGFGSDFDGIGSTPAGLEDVSKYPDLLAALLKRGVSDKAVANIVGRNLIRVWRKVDEVALGMQASGALPVEDDQDLGEERFEL
jgi:membrane dipeptidase